MTAAELLLKSATFLAALSTRQLPRLGDRRLRTARLLDRVAQLLLTMAALLEEGTEPIAECSELARYSQELETVLWATIGFLDRSKARYLADRLESAVDAPNTGFYLLRTLKRRIVATAWPDQTEIELAREAVSLELTQLKDAAGQFTAASNLMRVREE